MINRTFTELIEIINRHVEFDGINTTTINGLHFYKMSELNIRLPVIYRPSIYVVVQGNKQVILDNETFKYSQSKYLAVSVDLPLIGKVTTASKHKPYLCVQIDMNRQVMTELAIKLAATQKLSHKTTKGIFVGDMDDTLLDAILRLLRLLDAPQDIPYLSESLFEEIYYRLLSGPYGAAIIQTFLHDNNMQRIAKIINKMKADIAQPINIDELAILVNMSTSNFYNQFKKVTGFSPLQYLKRLRLTAARHIMLSDHKDAASTSYLVGYDSPSQFSREYTRLFGSPPQRDVKEFRQ